MADEADTAQLEPDAQVAAEPDAQSQADPDDTQDGGVDGGMSPEDARKLRSESQNLRKRLKDAEKKLQGIEQSKMTDQERREREEQELRGELERSRSEIRSLRVQTTAATLGFRDPRDAALLNWDAIDDPDDTEQVEKALRKLLRDRPHLGVGSEDIDAGARGRRSAQPIDMNTLIRNGARR